MFTSIRQTLDYLSGVGGMCLGLDSMRALLDQLSHPEDDVPRIHIAGTNGKGSVAALVTSALTACGMKTGKFCSPTVFSYQEMITVNGCAIDDAVFMSAADEAVRASDAIVRKGYRKPTRFEIETAMAYLVFSKVKCDCAVIETGLGGRDDATNTSEKTMIAVLTSIGIDHTAQLGASAEEITRVKADIIKDGCDVICAPADGAVRQIIEERAARQNACVHFAPFVNTLGITPAMRGAGQEINLSVAVEVLERLRARGWHLPDRAVEEGLRELRLAGRFETVAACPVVILDGAHNPAAARHLATAISEIRRDARVFGAVGIFKDKDAEGIASALSGVFDRVAAFGWDSPRARAAEETAQIFRESGTAAQTVSTVKDALQILRREAKETDVIVVFGSLSHLAEAKAGVEDLW